MTQRPAIDTQTLRRLLDEPEPPLVVAVASAEEHRRARIPGARLLGDVTIFTREVPQGRPIVVSGHDPGDLTAAWACRLLVESGYRDVRVHVGGLRAWEASGLTIERDP